MPLVGNECYKDLTNVRSVFQSTQEVGCAPVLDFSQLC